MPKSKRFALSPDIVDQDSKIAPKKHKNEQGKAPEDEKRPNIITFVDREQRYVAALLTRFKNLVVLAAMPAGEGATKEIAASHAFQMEVETNALVSIHAHTQPSWQTRTTEPWLMRDSPRQVQAAEDLLQLTRELKELWLAGPLREIGEDEESTGMAEDANRVRDMVSRVLKQASEVKEGVAVALQ